MLKEKHYKDVATLLIAKGADVNAKKASDLTPRSNIERIWKVDQNETNVKCDPDICWDTNPITGTGALQCILMINGERLEIVKKPEGYEARILRGVVAQQYNIPGAFAVKLSSEGETIKISNAPMYTCDTSIDKRFCPWWATFIVRQISVDRPEGTIEVTGFTPDVDNYKKFSGMVVPLRCDGNVVLRRE